MEGKSLDVIVVGELNVDLILNKIDSFPEIGKEKLAESMTLTLGGSSAIFASNLSAIGASVGFVGKIGDDSFGQLVNENLRGKGVNTDYLIKDSKSGTGATVVLNYGNDRAMVTFQGAMNNLTFEDISLEVLAKAKHLHFSSYFLQPGMKKNVGDLFRAAKKIGLTTSFDMQWDPAEKWDMDFRAVLPDVDIFLPNAQEIMKLTGENSIESALSKISAFSNVIVVKMGTKGSVLYESGELHYCKPFLNDQVVDAIGAGDSFNAGFIFQYINGKDLITCQEFGNLTGAINTTAAGGTAAFSNYNEILKTAQQRFGYNEKNIKR